MPKKSSPTIRELKLPFPHGIEVELQVIKQDGTWVKGEEVLEVFDRLVSSAITNLDRKIHDSSVESVRQKYRRSKQTEEGERGSRVVTSYEDPNGEVKEFTVVGHDPNVTSLTWILEIATPPCTTLEELAWWVQTLIAISYESIPKDANLMLISTGLNPAQEYLKNLSFGEHHHILGPDVPEHVRIGIYNMMRNFLPHIIALTVNSPFENKRTTDEVWVDESGKTRAPKCKRSIRLVHNTTQLGPTNEFEFIPYLEKPDPEEFARHVNRSFARMVDLYPFTRLDTIELRVSDTQLSVPRRIGVALILQALSMKTKKMIESGENIPNVEASVLAANRESAVEAGLWGPFKPTQIDSDSEFTKIYNMRIKDDGTINTKRRNRFLGDAVASMLYFIREELEELDIIDNPFMQPLLISIYGSEHVDAKTTGADFQLDVYAKSELNLVVLLRKLSEITRECCINWLYDPLEGTPNLPTWLCWWKGIEPEIVTERERIFAGQKAHATISIRNALEQPVKDLTLTYTIEDSDRHVVERNLIPIPVINPGDIHIENLDFDTSKGIPAYNILGIIGLGGQEIHVTASIQTFWTKASIRPTTTTIFADGSTQIPFSGEIETSFPDNESLSVKVSVLSPSREKILAQIEQPVSVEPGGIISFKNKDYPPLVVPDDFSGGVERCVLKIDLTDTDGEEVISNTSKPFYIGFVRKGPRLELDMPIKEIYKPGERIIGRVSISEKDESLAKDVSASIMFVADSGRRHAITSIPVKSLLEEPTEFEWKIPAIHSENTAERTGLIRIELLDDTEVISSTKSDRFKLEHVGVRINIDSLKLPSATEIGAKITGWLRIRRNTEAGDKAILDLVFKYPEGQEIKALSQPIRQSRNLSVAFGPVEVPKPESGEEYEQVDVIARISYGGEVIDSRTETIRLDGVDEPHLVRISFSGVPSFVTPDETLHSTIHVTNLSNDEQLCMLTARLDTVKGPLPIWQKEISLAPKQTELYAIGVDIPLSLEMSTAYLMAKATTTKGVTRGSKRLKIKAVEEAHYHFRFMIKDTNGVEVPGLVPRVTPIKLLLIGKATTKALDDVKILLRVMSRRKVVKLFEIDASKFKKRKDGEFDVEIPWTTPSVEMVTGFYLEALVEQKGQILPDRAVEQIPKQFTVY